jgi:hypothetical protein
MRKILLLLILFLKTVSTFGQLGLNTTSPHPSAVLDISSSNKGLLAPRMTSSERDLISSPANGLLVYCTDCSPKGVYIYNGGNWNEIALQTGEATTLKTGAVQLTGSLSGDAGNPLVSNESITSSMLADAAVTPSKITATTGGLNNQFLSTNSSGIPQWSSIPFSNFYTVSGASNIEIRGNGNAIEDAFEVPYYTESVTLPKGKYMYINSNAVMQLEKTNASDTYCNSVWIDILPNSGTVTSYGSAQIGFQNIYRFCTSGQAFVFEVLSNTANVKFRYKPCNSNLYQCCFRMAGAFGGNVYPLNSLETLGVSSALISTNCGTNGFSGTLIKDIAASATNQFKVTINNSSAYNLNIGFTTNDLVLSGVPGISVSNVSPSLCTLASGGSQIITYTLNGTASASGTLTGQWNYSGLSCSKTIDVLETGVTFKFPQVEYVASMLFTTPVAINEQGIIDNGANKITFNLDYGTSFSNFDYPAYTSAPISGVLGESDDTNTFTFSYPAGTISTSGGTIPVTISVGEDGIYNVKKQSVVNGEQTIVNLPFTFNGVTYGAINILAVGGIRDRMYNKKDNAGNYSHQMVYFPITGADGNKWLNNNLGANYATVGHSSFNPLQQAISSSDFNAFGSLFQWGRKADGHEIVNWLNSSTATLTTTTTSTVNTSNPGHALFIIAPVGNVTAGSNRWDGLNANNPCPKGYKVPTTQNLIAIKTFTNAAGAYATPWKFPLVPIRYQNDGTLAPLTLGSQIFSGNQAVSNSSYSSAIDFGTTYSNMLYEFPGGGGCVRCIKE